MAIRSTRLSIAVALAFLAIATLAAGAHACDVARSAAAKPACGSPMTRTASTSAPAALPSLAAPAPSAAPFATLPNFTRPVVTGLMAFIDPETGLLTGPISELQVPADLSNAFGSPPDLAPVPLAGGGFAVDLQGTLQDYYVLTIDPLGRRAMRCVQGPRHAHAPAAPLAPAEPIILPIAER